MAGPVVFTGRLGIFQPALDGIRGAVQTPPTGINPPYAGGGVGNPSRGAGIGERIHKGPIVLGRSAVFSAECGGDVAPTDLHGSTIVAAPVAVDGLRVWDCDVRLRVHIYSDDPRAGRIQPARVF